jgi:NAD(P)-dependent dehydrogenase (short-subunit alcohol dehydrogenase family)
MSKPLSGRVAVVAGATRGAGRGIARMLGEAGAEAAAEHAKKTYLAPLVDAGRFAKVDWKLVSKMEAPS